MPSTRWWRHRIPELVELGRTASPVYVYDLDTVRERVAALASMKHVARALYAVKANPHPAILNCVAEAGLDFECVSPGEIARVMDVVGQGAARRIVFTPNFAPKSEYAAALEAGVHVTIDALHPLCEWGDLLRGHEVSLRVDPGWGRGHHASVVTGGAASKFGIHVDELDEARALVEASGVRVVGLHMHSGSDIKDPGHWRDVAALLEDARTAFPSARSLNVGGGLGVPTREGDPAIDLSQIDTDLGPIAAANEDAELWLEPGRWVVAEAGVLLARVTQLKQKEGVRWIGTDVGMNSLLRPALYDAHHDIVNLDRLAEPQAGPAHVVGPICESGDRLGVERDLPVAQEGDVLLIDVVGAYGRVMASEYNLRAPAGEVVLAD